MADSKMRAVLTMESCISPEQCQQIITDCLTLPKKDAVVGDKDAPSHSLDIRSSTVRWVDRFPSIKNMVEHHFASANRMIYGFDTVNAVQIQFTEYHATSSDHYVWHDDCLGDKDGPYDRKLSLSLQLSDPRDYDGGKLQFAMDEEISTSASGQGDIVIFPSFRRHRVTPVTRGTRYSLVAWAEGPRWR